jgi:recombination protein RecA
MYTSNKVRPKISTGIPSLDIRLGGGIKPGITEVYGFKSSGRSTLGLNCIKWAQSAGLKTALVDTSDSFDKQQAIDFGINLDQDFWYAEDKFLECAFEKLYISIAQCELTVLDCLASAPSDKEQIDSNRYPNRRLISDYLRDVALRLNNNGHSLILINQSRQNIGYRSEEALRSYYGDLVKIYATSRIKLIEGPPIREDYHKIGVYIYAKVMKSEGVPSFHRTRIGMTSKGLDYVGDILDIGIQKNVLTRRGPYVFFEERNLGKSYKDICSYLNDNKEVWTLLEAQILEALDLHLYKTKQWSDV